MLEIDSEGVNDLYIYDIHAHVFPNKIALKASDSIGGFYDIEMERDGQLDSLLADYAATGINHGLIHSVAITPHSVNSINTFISQSVAAHPDTFSGFAAIHPDCEDIPALITEVRTLGLNGFKIHPDMQRFALDEPRSMDMFAAIEGIMPIIIHTGDTRFNYSHPSQMKHVLENFPRLTCVCAHLGGWSEWEDAYKTLSAYENVYVDTSSSLYAITPQSAAHVIRQYDINRVLFGTDYPMWSAQSELQRIARVPLTDTEREKIMGGNALRLLGE